MVKRGGGPIVIVGAGLTGGNAAKELRKRGYAGEVLILAEEPSYPFGRPPLTKGYLRGEEDLSGWMAAPPDWYQANQIQFVPATAAGVEPAAKQVRLDTGDAIGYARQMGLKVTSVMRGKAPLDAVLGAEVGSVFGAIHREAGIQQVVGRR